jgi:hypothetical protein
MCYNCGCEIPDDPMGKGKLHEGGASLVEDDLQFISDKWGMSLEETKKHIYNLLKKPIH